MLNEKIEDNRQRRNQRFADSSADVKSILYLLQTVRRQFNDRDLLVSDKFKENGTPISLQSRIETIMRHMRVLA